MAGTISVGGLASGLDVNNIVKQLIAAERAPKETRLNVREAQYSAELSAYGTLKSELNTLQGAVSGLRSAAGFNARTAVTSDKSVVSASASSIADAGSYSVEVQQLAQSQSLASVAFDDVNSTVGTGTLTFRFGTTDYDAGTDTYNSFTQQDGSSTHTLTVDSSNNTLSGLRDAINDKDMGVTASIVNDGSGYRLLLTSDKTGAENSLEIDVSDADFDAGTNADGHTDTDGLSRFAFNASATNLDQTMAAQDAKATVNGLAITRDTNSITGVIDGVTLTLNKADPGNQVSVDITKNTSKVASAINKFVGAYNQLNAVLNELGKYDQEKDQAGLLQGQPILRQVRAQMREALNPADGGGFGAFSSLADIGITTRTSAEDGELPGSLKLDQDKLNKALSDNFDDIAQLFAATGRAEDEQIEYLSSGADTQAGRYGVEVTRLATQGAYTGAAIAGYAGSITIDGANDTLKVKVDGDTSASITLAQGSYTGAELAAEIESLINGESALKDKGLSVAVEFDTDHLVIRSASYGSDSQLEISSVDTNTASALGLSVGAGTAGLDVAGRIGGVLAEGEGRVLTGRGGADGLRIEVKGGATGARGHVDFARGVADRLYASLEKLLGEDNPIAARTKGLEDRLEGVAEAREKLEERLTAMEERYMAEFTNLEIALAQMNKTSEYLAQQLENLPSFNKKK